VSEGVEVVIEGKYVLAIRPQGSASASPDSTVIDLGFAVLMPGLVNAHTHLELTLAQTDVKPKRRFTDWIREIVRVTSAWGEDEFNSSVEAGLRLIGESGTTALGDISRNARAMRKYVKSGIRARIFYEVIDFNPRTAGKTFDALLARIDKHPRNDNVLIGIAPHTPYTVSTDVLKQCIKLAHENDWRLCIHLAETEAEIEFLKQGTGEIREFREEFGIPRGWRPPEMSSVRYLERLGFFDQPCTLIHCNYVSEDDFCIIEQSASSVVFCPRSHSYFGHGNHPFLRMLDCGINVALGTDSLASSPTLSILDEMKFLHGEHTEVPLQTILRMATQNGLEALGLAGNAGALSNGSFADLVAVAVLSDESDGEDVLKLVFAEQSEVVFSLAEGTVLYDAHDADSRESIDRAQRH